MTDVWPYRPQVGMTEYIEFLTDVFQTRTTEQRLALREIPRQSFDVNHILKTAQFARSRQIARNNAGQEIYIPVWPEHVNLPGLIDSAETVLTFDTTTGDWRGAGALVIVWKSDENYVVREIDSMNDTSITLTASLGSDFYWPVVVPLRSGFTPEGFNIRRDTTYSELQAVLRVNPDDCVDLSGDYVSDYPQYNSLDVVTERTLLITSINEKIIRVSEYADSDLGIILTENEKNYVDFGKTIAFQEERPAGLWRRRLWLHALRGRQKTFWLPTFNDDFSLASSYSSGAATITVVSIGETGLYTDRHIMILLNDGNRYMRKINSASGAGDNDVLTLSSSIADSFVLADIDLFCFISLVRLDADRIQIDHAFAGDSNVIIPVIEVPDVL